MGRVIWSYLGRAGMRGMGNEGNGGAEMLHSLLPSFPLFPPSVSERLAGLQHVRDALLGPGHLRQGDEVLALQAQQPVLVHKRVAIDLAAAQDRGDAVRDL